MSWMYDNYLVQHRQAVYKAWEWLVENMKDELDDDALTKCGLHIRTHDASKNDVEEYGPYDEYFYGRVKSAETKEKFNRSWLHHIHQNPHHWQHWVLIEDDDPSGFVCIEIPLDYVYEMICDWWSFSWVEGNLYEIFDWYEKHRSMKLHPKTRAEVERILGLMKIRLDALMQDDEFDQAIETIRKDRIGAEE